MIGEQCWWAGLPELIAQLSGCTPGRAREMLSAGGVRVEGMCATGSALNSDGTPVEIAVSVSWEGRRVRVVMDPAHWEVDPVRRSRRAREACERLADSLPPALRHHLLGGVRMAWPDDAALAGWLPWGCLWVGAEPGRPGIAAYLSARWGPPAERWPRVFDWVQRQGIMPAEPLAAAARYGEPASVSLAAGRELKVRVYYRLCRPLRLADLGLPALDETAMAGFLAAVIGERPIRCAGLLLSVSAVAGAGAFGGCKVDVCAHCVSRSPVEWAVLIERLAAEFGLPPPGLVPVLLGGQAEMAFIGLGFPEAGARQLNCYLKAPVRRRFLAASHV
ncbi:MAG: hypothetical protein RMI94_01645 [Bryobacterales bacterium]|nr:hypothetical protein [Bryobacteraceae bacterium]MDW8129223.1 hypothetical protein [Bryobacterales bacterium]